MKIIINENWQIVSDPCNIILQKKRITEKGKNIGRESWDSISFHPSVNEALKDCMKQEIHSVDLEGVKAINEHISSVYRQIEGMKVEVE